jgi:hypothetical protein
VRRAWLLLLFVGCDQVYGLKDRVDAAIDAPMNGVVEGFDDDGDGTPNDSDLCPHIAGESGEDKDLDGIGTDCDSNDSALSERVYLPLIGGAISPLAVVSGSGKEDGNGFVLGSKMTRFDAIALDEVDADYVDIQIGFEMRENSIENMGDSGNWAELALYAGNHSFSENSERGNVCFFGRSGQPDQVYLELVENDSASTVLGLDTPLNGSRGTLHMRRTPTRWDCTVLRDDETTTNYRAVTTGPGRVGISAERTAAWIDWIWIAYD